MSNIQGTTQAEEAKHATAPGSRVPIKPGTMLSVRMPTDVNLSPNGERAAFVVREFVADKPKECGRIWVVETAGGEPKPFSRGTKEDTCPRWSPDSQQLSHNCIFSQYRAARQKKCVQCPMGSAT